MSDELDRLALARTVLDRVTVDGVPLLEVADPDAREPIDRLAVAAASFSERGELYVAARDATAAGELAAGYDRLMAPVTYDGVPWAQLTEAQRQTVVSALEAYVEPYYRLRELGLA